MFFSNDINMYNLNRKNKEYVFFLKNISLKFSLKITEIIFFFISVNFYIQKIYMRTHKRIFNKYYINFDIF